jgi:DOMON domain
LSTEEAAKSSAAGESAATPSGSQLDQCGSGYWRFPRTCEKDDCEYEAKWTVQGDNAHFTIRTKHTDLWTGIAFSQNERMSQTDAVLGWVDRAGRSFIMDTWISGYQAPQLDAQQDVTNVTGRISDGFTVLSFQRPLDTRDPKDVALGGKDCPYIMFPIKGGKFNSVNKKIWKHDEVPALTGHKVCLRPCAAGSTTTTPAPPPTLSYNAEVRLVSLGEGFKVPTRGSADFNTLADTVGNALAAGSLKQVPGLNNVIVRQFKK